MTLNDFIHWSICKIKCERKDSTETFYDYVSRILKEWQANLSLVDKNELLECIKLEMIKPTKEKSFYQLIHNITEKYIEILKYSYQGDVFEAITLLRKLLYAQKYTQYKLSDKYINYFSFKRVTTDKHLYRVIYYRNETLQNCNHVPFEKRNLAKHNRFNAFGYPCLYLSENKDVCVLEIGGKRENEKMFYSKFMHKRDISYLNLTIPQNLSEMTIYDKFCFIIKYPMLLLCSTSTVEDDKYEEEYLFSQLLIPALFLTNNEIFSYKGIAYNSVIDYKTLNLVIPAKLKADEIKPQNKVAEYISDIITEDGPY